MRVFHAFPVTADPYLFVLHGEGMKQVLSKYRSTNKVWGVHSPAVSMDLQPEGCTADPHKIPIGNVPVSCLQQALERTDKRIFFPFPECQWIELFDQRRVADEFLK